MNNVHPAFAPALRWIAPSLPKRGHSKTTTVNYAGLPLTVAYNYSPAEAPVYDADSPMAGPGCPASVEAYEVKLGEHDLTQLFSEYESGREAIEAKVLEQLGEA